MRITVIKQAGAFLPAMKSDIDAAAKLRDGEALEFEARRARIYPHLQKYWALCNMVAENKRIDGLESLDTREAVHEYVKLKLGLVDLRIVVKDRVHLKTKSINYASMDQEEFSDFYRKAVEVLAGIAGLGSYELENNWNEYECGTPKD
jgi:hypothetical protein